MLKDEKNKITLLLGTSLLGFSVLALASEVYVITPGKKFNSVVMEYAQNKHEEQLSIQDQRFKAALKLFSESNAHLANFNKLRVKDEIFIPWQYSSKAWRESHVKADSYISYKVKQGDTLYDIAINQYPDYKFGPSWLLVDVIKEFNPGINDHNKIWSGKIIRLPKIDFSYKKEQASKELASASSDDIMNESKPKEALKETKGFISQVLDVVYSVSDYLEVFGRRVASTGDYAKAEAVKKEPAISNDFYASSDDESIFGDNFLKDAYAKVGIGVLYDFYRIDSSDLNDSADATILSSPSLGFRLFWDQYWSHKWGTEISLEHQEVKMKRAGDGVVNNKNQDVGGIELALKYRLSRAYWLNFHTKYRSFIFSRSETAGEATLDAINLGQLGVSLKAIALKSSKFRLDLDLGYNILMGAEDFEDYKIESMNELFIASRIWGKLINKDAFVELKYHQIDLESSISNQTEKRLGVQFGLSYDIGK